MTSSVSVLSFDLCDGFPFFVRQLAVVNVPLRVDLRSQHELVHGAVGQTLAARTPALVAAAAVADVEHGSIKVYPVISTSGVWVELPWTKKHFQLYLYNMGGTVVAQKEVQTK